MDCPIVEAVKEIRGGCWENETGFSDNNLVKINQNVGNQLNQGNKSNTTDNKEINSNNGDTNSSKISLVSNDKDLKTANFSINNNNLFFSYLQYIYD